MKNIGTTIHLKNEFHFSQVGSCEKLINHQGFHENFASNVVYISINIRKIKFITYIYIRFSQRFDEKSDINTKIEAVKHLHAVFLLTSEQGQ